MVAAGARTPGVLTEVDGATDDDELLWEIPQADEASTGTPLRGAYVWVAAEQGVVRGIRRHLLGEVGLGRAQVALMGYWRLGGAQA